MSKSTNATINRSSEFRPTTHAPENGADFCLRVLACLSRKSVLFALECGIHRDPFFSLFASQGCVHGVLLRFFLFNFPLAAIPAIMTYSCAIVARQIHRLESLQPCLFSAQEILFRTHLERKTGTRSRSRKNPRRSMAPVCGAYVIMSWPGRAGPYARVIASISEFQFRYVMDDECSTLSII